MLLRVRTKIQFITYVTNEVYSAHILYKCIYKSEIKSILPCRVLKLSKRLLYSCYSFQKCVWEPAVVKINAITAASEAACLILSVDETVKNPRSGQGEGGMPPGGGMPMGGMGRGRGRPM